MDAETRVTPWSPYPHYGIKEVRIWFKLTPFGMWQRHEWRREDGAVSLDRWIPHSGRSWPHGATATTSEPTDFEALMAALMRIAGGHNNPRELATETLAQIGHQA